MKPPKRKRVTFTPKQELAILRNRQDLIAAVLGFRNWRALEDFSRPGDRVRVKVTKLERGK